MHAKWNRVVLILLIAVFGSTMSFAQTDVAASLYGAFTGTTNGNGTAQSPSNSAGGLIEVRHIDNPILGYEVTYAFNRANEKYSNGFNSQAVSANAHEITGDWVPSLSIANFKPFGVLGAGLLLDVPTANQRGTSTSTKPVYVYGAGVDWGVLPHLGLRFQYRGNLYSAPNVSSLYTSTKTFTHTAEPMIGVYFRL